jgi:hypothetical protein
MSQAKRGGRFSYLTSAGESTETKLPNEEASGQEKDGSSSSEHEEPVNKTESSGGGEEGRSLTSREDVLASVPKGTGRMKQERSQLNVRLPTSLKRQASAKAVLEGRDIGEVVEELLREYLKR